MLLAAWENEQALIEKKEKEVSSLAKVGLGGGPEVRKQNRRGTQAPRWGRGLTCTVNERRLCALESSFQLLHFVEGTLGSQPR